MRLHHRLHDGQPEARAARAAAARGVGAVEAVEQQLRVDVAESGAVVLDGEDGVALEAEQLDGDVAVGLDEAARVLHEVRHGLLEAVGVAQHVGGLADDLGGRVTVAQEGLERVEHARGQLAQVHARQLHGHRRVVEALQRQQVVGEAAQALALVDDDGAELLVQLGR